MPVHRKALSLYATKPNMNRLLSILLLCLTLPLSSFKGDQDLTKEKYLNFLAAIENISTFSYFTVVKIKDLNTGITKEICTKGNFVSGALHIELNADYDAKGEKKVLDFAKTKKDRYFELKNKKALDNISFYDYDLKQLKKIQSKYDIDKVVQLIKKDKNFSIHLSDKEMKYFAHLLFNKGYMTGENNCFGGILEYVDRMNPEY